MLGGRLVGRLLLILGRKVEVGGGDVGELDVAGVGTLVLGVTGHGVHVVGAHELEHELVDVLSAEKHVEAMVHGRRHHRHLLQTVTGVAGGVVDLLLISRHGGHVLLERNLLALLGRPEQKQVRQVSGLRAVGVVDAKLEPTAKVAKELLVSLAVVVTHVLELGVNLLLDAAGNGPEL